MVNDLLKMRVLEAVQDCAKLPVGAQNRLKALKAAMDNERHTLCYQEFQWLFVAIIHSIRGSGGGAPSTLDIPCISAPVRDLKACRRPSWLQVACHHGNTAWKMARCRSCDGCIHAWKSRVRAIILSGCYGRDAYMWTLTMPEYSSRKGLTIPKGRSIVDGDIFDLAQSRWHNLLRESGKREIRFEYLRVVELQKRGTPHFHMAVKNIRKGGKAYGSNKAIIRDFRSLAKRAGFGFLQGKTFDFQAARLGGAGVASYMSKYLSKSDDYNQLRREDGRAIRRYCRSKGWSTPKSPSVFRYARTGMALSHVQQVSQGVICECGEGMLLRREVQVRKWRAANKRNGSWVAPLGVADFILDKEKV